MHPPAWWQDKPLLCIFSKINPSPAFKIRKVASHCLLGSSSSWSSHLASQLVSLVLFSLQLSSLPKALKSYDYAESCALKKKKNASHQERRCLPVMSPALFLLLCIFKYHNLVNMQQASPHFMKKYSRKHPSPPAFVFSGSPSDSVWKILVNKEATKGGKSFTNLFSARSPEPHAPRTRGLVAQPGSHQRGPPKPAASPMQP